MPDWEPVIGLEIHARLSTRTKLFCGCATDFGAPPNTQVCPVCLAYPGALPVLNRAAVNLAMRMAIATGCTIHHASTFARKSYFYPDLPKGYQISQYDRPIATNGAMVVGERTIRIQRIHIEEDAGKLLHRDDVSLVDLNRAGTPLIEIVSEPDVRTSAEAADYFARIRQTLMYADVCDGNMEEGSLRCDANVSVRRAGEPLGTRAEIKNLNSFRFLARAIDFEIERQTRLLESGQRIVQETRLFDASSNETRPMRSKEEAHDYRYFPEPDLFELRVDDGWIAAAASEVPELPRARSARYQREWGIGTKDADALTASRELAAYFEATAVASGQPRLAANWVRNEVLRVVNETHTGVERFPLQARHLASLIRLIEDGTIGGKTAKEVFEEIATSGEDPAVVVQRKGLAQISDRALIAEAAARVVEQNREQAAAYRAGKSQLFGFFVGRLLKEFGGRANAEIANAVLRELLDGDQPAQ